MCALHLLVIMSYCFLLALCTRDAGSRGAAGERASASQTLNDGGGSMPLQL